MLYSNPYIDYMDFFNSNKINQVKNTINLLATYYPNFHFDYIIDKKSGLSKGMSHKYCKGSVGHMR